MFEAAEFGKLCLAAGAGAGILAAMDYARPSGHVTLRGRPIALEG
jgi:hypothetical protein